ncbi:ribosome biogenesis GTPase YlqF [Thiomicrospira microaerophila]|uniref:ribosome biogenesis GTPase YlqF n=1 Tax=Thiomicrospira microaerophila TaxID=406020 RepID=UPI00201019A9|nr:ribosome biogenesis GTPase YlqF [Thiomicrospira microaerophila]UQB41274.1 ribosome biogenesis GTPase YlqF [Thiomicrospira microaerophila]
MAINWFPGHMHKARKDIAEVMPQVDVIIEMLDARIPFSSENPLVNGLRGDTPCIKLLNKADLADPEMTKVWVTHFEQQKGVRAIPISQQNPEQIKALLKLATELVGERDWAVRPARAMIMGIPNVGKSTLINTLAGRTIAKTGNEAGVTKSQQKIKLANNIYLTDTPGFLWPKLTPPEAGYRLAITGGIKDTAFEFPDIALFAAEFLLKQYPERLVQRYGLTELPPHDEDLLVAIGKKRGCVGKGGSVDWDKVSRILINELREGKLGQYTLESPEGVQEETQRAQQLEQQKAELKAQRAEERKARTKKNRR